jgi:hypothetical protein
MHPLSWNVYGGHLENIRLLLEAGANVNMDFDSMGPDGAPTTVLDVLLQLQSNEQGDERFIQMEPLLRQHGAKTIEELTLEQQQERAEETKSHKSTASEEL